MCLGPGSHVHVLGQGNVCHRDKSLGKNAVLMCLGHGYRVFGAWISCAWGMDITCLGHGSYVFGAWISCAWRVDIMLA